VRGFGLHAHRDFCEVAIAADGVVRSAGRIATRVEAIEVFAQSLVAGDVVALEATSGSDRIVSILQRHGVRVVVANTRRLRSITEAKAKTDRLDARALARLLVSGLLDEVWTPDERSRTLRRLTGRRERVVRARTRAKNEVHGVLGRNLCDRPPVLHLFSKAGRRWLAALELPLDERLTLDGCLRQIDFLDSEIASLDAVIARQALAWPEVLRLMTVPGVNVQTAATFMASVGDIRRFSSPRQLVSYLGLDPRVRQSGNAAARHGRISKAGASVPRHMLGEVAWKVARTPGPLRAFFERVRGAPRPADRGHRDRQKARRALLAPAHPRAGLCLRPAGDDPQQDPPPRAARRRAAPEGPPRDRRRQVQGRLRRGARTLAPGRGRISPPGQRLAGHRAAEGGCGRDTGARISEVLEGQSRAASSIAPRPALRFVSHPHPTGGSHHPTPATT
jgi:transposase